MSCPRATTHRAPSLRGFSPGDGRAHSLGVYCSDFITSRKKERRIDDNEETGILCDGSLHSLPEQMKLMILKWGGTSLASGSGNDQSQKTNVQGKIHEANTPDILRECKLVNEDPSAMIPNPPAGARSESSWNRGARTQRGEESRPRPSKGWPL